VICGETICSLLFVVVVAVLELVINRFMQQVSSKISMVVILFGFPMFPLLF